MDFSTEFASNFTFARYHELREDLIADERRAAAAWEELIGAVERRMNERFLTPINQLARFDDEDILPYRPGFAILALDCLVIDTIQSLREGRAKTVAVSPAYSFKTFLKSDRFSEFKPKDRGDFFGYVRNAILHNGETRNGWKIRIDTESMIESVSGTKTINRRLFHSAVEAEFRDLLDLVRSGDAETRKSFLRRLDAMAEFPIDAKPHLYFAYGSNLNDEECRRSAPNAEGYAIAFLPGYRLAFTKHSNTRQGDAATIKKDSSCMVWGYVYRTTDRDKKALEKREGGYEEVELTVYLTSPSGEDEPTPVRAYTFVALAECPQHCGPPLAYVDLISAGARKRQLPDDYLLTFDSQR